MKIVIHNAACKNTNLLNYECKCVIIKRGGEKLLCVVHLEEGVWETERDNE